MCVCVAGYVGDVVVTNDRGVGVVTASVVGVICSYVAVPDRAGMIIAGTAVCVFVGGGIVVGIVVVDGCSSAAVVAVGGCGRCAVVAAVTYVVIVTVVGILVLSCDDDADGVVDVAVVGVAGG